MNGSLDFKEYTLCLSECPCIDLTKPEMITIAMAADVNGDGVIDFEEFMKHFQDVLNMIQFQKEIKDNFDLVQQQELEKLRLGKMEDLNGVGSLAQQEMLKMKA